MAYVVGSASVEIVPDFRNAQLAITAWFNKQQNELRVPVKPNISPEATREAEQQATKTGARVGKAMADAAEKQAEAQRLRDRRAQETLGAQMARDIERAAANRIKAQERTDARSLQQTIRAIERETAETQRIRDRAHQDAIREEERTAKAMLAAINSVFEDAEKARIQIELDRDQLITEGRTSGGLVARAIKQEIHQNAGLITAAVTGAIIAGGPLAAAAASGLFIGIGAVGAFQSQKLREDWVDTFGDIADAGISDSAVLVPAFQRMAVNIGGSFERMRPQIRNAFAELPDQIDIFTDSLTEAAENALPGLVRSVQAGRPVMSGFGNLVEDIGQGTSDLFDNITDHAPAAGQSLSYLGGTMGELLPLLGELLGEGAELGTIVLPVLNASLGGMRTVVESLGGSLPILATGFLAFRTVQGTGRFVNQLSQGMLNAAPNIGIFAERLTGSAVAGERVMTATGRAASAAASFGRALPAVGIGVAVLAAGMANAEQQTSSYATSLLKGGAAARQAMSDAKDNGELQDTVQTWTGMGFVVDLFTGDAEEAAEAADKLYDSMSPLEQAQSRVAYWTEELAFRLGDQDSSASDVAIAQRKLAEWTQRSAAEQETLERAVRGVTEAMAEQADAARARVDAEFAYQQSTLDVQEAFAEYEATLNDTEATAGEVAQALLDVNTALRDQAAAAGDKAMERLPASMDDAQKAILGAKGSLDELNGMIAMGIKLPPEMEQWRLSLIDITGEADGAKLAQAQLASALGEVGVAVTAIPGTKAVQITAPTEDLRFRLEELGFRIQDIPGTKDVQVSAHTDEAKANLGNLSTLLAGVDEARPTPVVALNTGPLDVGVGLANGLLLGLDGERPTPIANLNSGPFAGGAASVFASVRAIADLRPIPVAGLNSDPFKGGAAGVFATGRDLGQMAPRPTVDIIDNASGPISNIQGGLNNLRDKSITITTKQVVQAVTNFQLPGFGGASGGAIEDLRPRYKFDGGGAVVGRGGPRDDLIPAIGPNPFARYSIANGEHILDGRDVALMGGQAGVYAFREMLNSGAFSGPPSSTGIREMVAVSGGQAAGAAAARPSTPPRSVSLYTPDVPAALRELKALEHREEVLASPWP